MHLVQVVAADLTQFTEPDPFPDDRVAAGDLQAAAGAQPAEPQLPAIPVEVGVFP